jgi:hypothetical protein
VLASHGMACGPCISDLRAPYRPQDQRSRSSAITGGYFVSSSWASVTESDVVLSQQAIDSGMGLWCQAYQGTLEG